MLIRRRKIMNFEAIQNIANLKSQLDIQRELIRDYGVYSKSCDASTLAGRSKGTYSDPVYTAFCKSEKLKEIMRRDFREYESELSNALSELQSIEDIKVRN